jgi:hypothetical protein
MTPTRMARVRLVVDEGRIGLALRRCGRWWLVISDTGWVYADTESEEQARDVFALEVARLEADGAWVRRRWGSELEET